MLLVGFLEIANGALLAGTDRMHTHKRRINKYTSPEKSDVEVW